MAHYLYYAGHMCIYIYIYINIYIYHVWDVYLLFVVHYSFINLIIVT